MATATLKKPKFTSRAVTRTVEAGNSAICVHCDEQVKFTAKMRTYQIICNVYDHGQWVKVEHFHAECYDLAQQPHGEPGPLANTRIQMLEARRAAEEARRAAIEAAEL